MSNRFNFRQMLKVEFLFHGCFVIFLLIIIVIKSTE